MQRQNITAGVTLTLRAVSCGPPPRHSSSGQGSADAGFIAASALGLNDKTLVHVCVRISIPRKTVQHQTIKFGMEYPPFTPAQPPATRKVPTTELSGVNDDK